MHSRPLLVCRVTRQIRLSAYWLAGSLAWSLALTLFFALLLAVTP